MWTLMNVTFQKACSCFSAVSEHAYLPVPWLALNWNGSSFYWKLSCRMEGFKLKWTEEIADSFSLSQSLSSKWLDTIAAYYVRYSTNGACIKMHAFEVWGPWDRRLRIYSHSGAEQFSRKPAYWYYPSQITGRHLFHWEELGYNHIWHLHGTPIHPCRLIFQLSGLWSFELTVACIL